MLNSTFYPERLEEIGDIENKAVLKKVAQAHQALAELKATAESMPDQIRTTCTSLTFSSTGTSQLLMHRQTVYAPPQHPDDIILFRVSTLSTTAAAELVGWSTSYTW